MSPERNRGRLILICILAVSLLGNALAAGAGLRLYQLRADLLGEHGFATVQEPEVRQALNTALAEHKDQIKPALQDFMKARIAAMETGSTQPLDLEATKAKMAETRAAMDILLDRVQEALLAGLINYAEAQD